MDDFFGNLVAFAGIVLAVIFLTPIVFSVAIIDWVGNYTDSAVIYILIHFVIGFPFLLFAVRFASDMGFWLTLIIGGTAAFLLLIALTNSIDLINGEFDYSIYNTLDNWNPPAGEAIENGES